MTISVGDIVLVTDSGYTYTAFDSWQDIGQVPFFTHHHAPDVGFCYTITHVGKHSGASSRSLYVLNGRYIVDERGFQVTQRGQTSVVDRPDNKSWCVIDKQPEPDSDNHYYRK